MPVRVLSRSRRQTFVHAYRHATGRLTLARHAGKITGYKRRNRRTRARGTHTKNSNRCRRLGMTRWSADWLIKNSSARCHTRQPSKAATASTSKQRFGSHQTFRVIHMGSLWSRLCFTNRWSLENARYTAVRTAGYPPQQVTYINPTFKFPGRKKTGERGYCRPVS